MKTGGFQKLTLLDFPGEVACIVFTSGCNFRCPFCHNSGLLSGEAQIDTDEIFSYLKKRGGVLDGVVITGGEPLMQADIVDFIKEIRSMGYKIKLDTNGSYPDRLRELLEEGLIDYAAMDIKHTPEKYSLAAGVGGEIIKNIEKSINLLKSCNITAEFRTTFVNGIHKTADAKEISRFLSTDRPYYIQSYTDSGSVLSPDGLSAFSKEELDKMLYEARRFCPNAALRGL